MLAISCTTTSAVYSQTHLQMHFKHELLKITCLLTLLNHLDVPTLTYSDMSLVNLD